eukprot:4524629-Prymnesium_polylepis.1
MCEVTRLLARHCPVASPGCRSLREPALTRLHTDPTRATRYFALRVGFLFARVARDVSTPCAMSGSRASFSGTKMSGEFIG